MPLIMVEREFGGNDLKAWIHLVCINSSGSCWCNDVGGYVFLLTLVALVPTQHCLSAPVYLNIVLHSVAIF